MHIHRIGDVTVLNDFAPVPAMGGAPPLFLPVNAFVLHAEQPVVIDSGLSTADKDFVSALAEVIDPADIRWLWITHPDRDHTGGLWQLLEAAPAARLVTTFLGMGIMSLEWTIPLNRIFLLNPGQALDVGDRRLHCFRPPLFDNPSTTGFLDDRTGAAVQLRLLRGPNAVGGAGHLRRCTGRRRRGSRLSAPLGINRQPVGAPRRPGKIPRHGRSSPCHGSLRSLQHPPAPSPGARRPALRDRTARAADKPVRRPRPSGTRGPARHIRA
jgi:hypothetical protein